MLASKATPPVAEVYVTMLVSLTGASLCSLQTHDQAVDPNLVRLAEAYEVAATAMQSQVQTSEAQGSADNSS